MILTNELAQKYIDFHSNDFFNHFLEDFNSISNLRNEKSKYLETEISKVEDILENREFVIYGRFINFENKPPWRIMLIYSKYFEGSQYRNRKGENYKSEYSYQYDTYVVQKKTMACIGTTLYKPFEGDLSELTDDYIKVPMDEKDFCNIYLSDFDVFLLSIFLDQLLDFKNTFEPAAPVVQSESTAPPAEKEKQNLFCPSMPLSVPIEYFRLFTTERNNKGQAYLSVADFDKFIDRAFCGNADMEKLKLNYDAKNYVISIFYTFYSDKGKDYENNSQCVPKYVNLLCDNFIGFEFQKVENNFKPIRKVRK